LLSFWLLHLNIDLCAKTLVKHLCAKPLVFYIFGLCAEPLVKHLCAKPLVFYRLPNFHKIFAYFAAQNYGHFFGGRFLFSPRDRPSKPPFFFNKANIFTPLVA
jgi:hypothetical protein